MRDKYYLTNTKTAINLARSFAYESQTRTRYLFYSKEAKKEGFHTLKKVFLEIANDETGHAEAFYEFLTSGLKKTTLNPQTLIPIGYGSTEENLLSAAQFEHLVWSDYYPIYGNVAENEGFYEIAESFYSIAMVEKQHELKLLHLLKETRNHTLYHSQEDTTWICTNCGYHHFGKSAPEICPACRHPQSFFISIEDKNFPTKYFT